MSLGIDVGHNIINYNPRATKQRQGVEVQFSSVLNRCTDILKN